MAQPRLLAVSGPLKGSTFDLGVGETSIGRTFGASIVIDHKSVSRLHCELRSRGASFTVRDNGSLNGTSVNGLRVEECVLNHGDQIMVGSSSFIFLSQDEDLSSLLSNVRLLDDSFDPAASVEIPVDGTLYLEPERALAGAADARILKNFSALLKLGATLQASQRLASLEEQALQLIMEAIPAETGAIILTGNKPDQILSAYGRHRDGSEALTVSRGVIRHVLQAGTALLTNDAIRALPGNETLISSDARSLLCVPVISADRAFGVIYLASGEGLPGFVESHLQLLAAMAAMLALPLESARRVDWLEKENARLQSDIGEHHRLIGDSSEMKQVYKLISRVAQTDSTVLVRGESGTGKELIARAIHRASRRAKAPFVVINCAALRGELLESELFGHEKGAFTGAIAQKKGRFEIADGGSVFLDEVAELAPDLQVKLLRVLQELEFERVGGNQPVKVDVRVIAATDRDLEKDIDQGRFRHELYYRLNVVSIEAPPLREHRQDIPPLAEYFAARYAERCNSPIRGISAEAEACLMQYEWPGNVRELQNAIERAVVLGESDLILPDDLPESVVESHEPSRDKPMRFHDGVRDAKRRLIQSAIEQGGENLAEAARLLGVNRTYLHRLMRNLGILKTGQF